MAYPTGVLKPNDTSEVRTMTVKDVLELCGGFLAGLFVGWVTVGSIRAHVSDEVNKVRLDVATGFAGASHKTEKN